VASGHVTSRLTGRKSYQYLLADPIGPTSSASDSSLKGQRTDSVHYLERDEVNGLKLLRRQQQANGIKAAYVFINERGQPFGRMGIGRMIERAGEAAGLPFPVHVHAAAFDRIRTGGQGNGHTATSALPRACLNHEHRALHGDVARTVQRHLALISAHHRRIDSAW
jgi:hypothetical protein